MDYVNQSMAFKLKKAFRYTLLYGPSRTYCKVKGQYHMKKKYDVLPELNANYKGTGHVGILGCGNYAFSNIAYYLNKEFGKVIRASMDVDINKAASLYEEYGLEYYTDDVDKIICDKNIDTLYIASNHATHAEYAIKALRLNKNVHIEKPHVVSFDQLERLCKAASESSGKILSIGYNRPKSHMGVKIKDVLWSQTGASMFNWFVAGHELEPDHWYFKEEEGGRVLGNLCHWTDFTYSMVQPECRYPIIIKPVRSKKSDCDIAVNYIFGDGSIAVITFSAKGHTFEGVREKFSAHRGNILVSMDDFHRLVIENVDKKCISKKMFRDHGHKKSIVGSYLNSTSSEVVALPIDYVWEAGELFLSTRDSLESNEMHTIYKSDAFK